MLKVLSGVNCMGLEQLKLLRCKPCGKFSGMSERFLTREGPGLPKIYVDFEDSPILTGLITDVIANINDSKDEQNILKIIFDKVSNHFIFRRETEVDELVPRSQLETISLEKFLEKQTGTCVQTTLTFKAITNSLFDNGLLENTGEYEHLSGDRYSHVWYEYPLVNSVICVDIVSHFFGQSNDYKDKILNDLINNAFY